MKSKNLNSSSKKTKNLIKSIFAKELSEKKVIEKISVSELCKKADISRGAFYTHYDDIYGVAQDYENELIDSFFTKEKLKNLSNFEQFIDYFFSYIRENDESYKLLCNSNDFVFSATKLITIASKNIIELVYKNNPKSTEFLELEINIFIEGLVCEYVRYCRGSRNVNLNELYLYTLKWFKNFIKERFWFGIYSKNVNFV